MSRIAWHLKNIRPLIYTGSALLIVGIAIVSAFDAPDASRAWIVARQLYGLWALGLLLASMLPGPLGFVLPWIPFKAHLVMGRRALGISSFLLALAHIGCYLGPVAVSGSWHTLFDSGILWICGLSIGLASFLILAVLASTSRRESIRNLNPRRWKRLHRSVYFLLPAALLHATFTGTDFGVNQPPDVNGSGDAGCLVGMLLVSLAWLVLFLLRKYQVRWIPAMLQRRPLQRVAGPSLR